MAAIVFLAGQSMKNVVMSVDVAAFVAPPNVSISDAVTRQTWPATVHRACAAAAPFRTDPENVTGPGGTR